MSTNHYDIVVIGGGIHGAGVAQAAVAAGYTVLVLEQNELASGTSSRSSKLIHGGLRYLEQGQLGLVRECLHERTLLLKLAPELVQLKPFFIPVYQNSSRSRWQLRAGLSIYALLAGGGQAACFHSVPHRKWDTLDGLQTKNLRGIFQYWDAQTDDAALTKAVMASAQNLGAEVKTAAKFTGAVLENSNCEVSYFHNKQEQLCTANVVINAAGPWANNVLAKVSPKITPLEVELVQGTHLVLEGQINQGIYYLESPHDQRPVFAMPWKYTNAMRNVQNAILLGTTENTYVGDPGDVQPLQKEQDYLLDTYHHYFAGKPKIIEAFAGLRVLPKSDSHHGARPRDTVLHSNQEGIPQWVSIYGGKLTAYRATAEKLMRMLSPTLPKKQRIADTRTLKLRVV